LTGVDGKIKELIMDAAAAGNDVRLLPETNSVLSGVGLIDRKGRSSINRFMGAQVRSSICSAGRVPRRKVR
jgi:hypothetical protein